MTGRIALLRPRQWPLANVRVAEALAAEFPDHQIDVIDVLDLMRRKRLVMAINCLAVVRLYGRDLLRRRRGFKDSFWRTPYFFAAVGKVISRHLAGVDYEVTFQMQSLFDGSQPGVPHFVYTDHTHLANLGYEGFDPAKLYSPRWIRREREVYEHATGIFVRSGHIATSLEQQYGIDPDKITCVRAGSNIPEPPDGFVAPEYEQQRVLFVGSDWERKGGPELVEAFTQARVRFPTATLTIIGASPTVDAPGCTVVGRLRNDELLPYYRAATIFCLPTRVEPFGIAFLEAMAAGLPIIGANVGAVPEFLQHQANGLLVEPDDVDGLRAALETLLGDPMLRRRYGERGRQIVTELYSWPVVARAMALPIRAALRER